MTDSIDPPAPKERRLLMRLLKITFWISAFILVGITILANMGGNSDDLKETAQGFVGQVFGGRPATIGTLNHMGFFPNVGFNAEDIRVLTDTENNFAIIHAKKINVFMKFWDVVLQDPKFSHFYVEELHAIRGALGVEEVFIEKIFIDHDPEAQKAVLRGNGTMGDYNWDFTLSLAIYGALNNYKYNIPETFKVEINLAELSFTSTVINHRDGFYKLENYDLSSPEHNLSGNITLSSLGEGLVKAKGETLLSNDRTHIVHDLIFDYGRQTPELSGDLQFPVLNISDFQGDNSSLEILDRIREVTGFSEVIEQSEKNSLLGSRDFDLDVQIDALITEHGSYEGLSFDVLKQNNMMSVSRISLDKKIIHPSVFLLPDNAEEQKHTLLMQSGDFDTRLWTLFLPDFKRLFKEGGQILQIKCGLGSLSYQHPKIEMDDFTVAYEGGNFTLETKTIDLKDLSRLKFAPKPDATLDVTGLNSTSYEFLQSYNRTQSEESGCAPFVFQATSEEEQE